MTENTFGKRLSALLEECGMSQRELADKIGITEVSMSRYIRSERVPRATEIINMAKVLGVPTAYLIGTEQPHISAPVGKKGVKYCVIAELDNGYMDCVAICESEAEAYGKAYLCLVDGLDEDKYRISLPNAREGDNGVIIECADTETGKAVQWVTILRYKED